MEHVNKEKVLKAMEGKGNGSKKDIYCWHEKETVISWSDNETRELRKYDAHGTFGIQEGNHRETYIN